MTTKEVVTMQSITNLTNETMTNLTGPKVGSSNQKKVKHCEFCGAELEQLFCKIDGIVYYAPSYKACSCDEAVAKKEKEKQENNAKIAAEKKEALERANQERIKKLFGNSGMSKRALNCKFDGYQSTIFNQDALKSCNEYVNAFKAIRNQHRNGLFIVGNCGVGKSHLAYAVANALIENNTSVICMTMIDLLLKIKSSFQSNLQTEDEILKIYEDCSLLVIDDLGKEKPTEWALQMIYTIIDRRYNALKPVVITTNYSAGELVNRFTLNGDSSTGTAIVDRLFEMCQYIPIKGDSFRKR